MNNYEEKRQRRAERYRDLARKAESNSNGAYETASKIGSFIPMGQPILVGHHSEKRHRRDLAKIDFNMRKSVEARSKAAYYRDKAEAAENNTAISSDNPEAIQLLKNKLDNLTRLQEIYKQANKIARSKQLQESKVLALIKLGFKESLALEVMEKGIDSFRLTNNNANINRIKKRILALEKQANEHTTEENPAEGIKVIDNVEDNRLQVFFDSKPSEEVRKYLKSNAFKWSPLNGCWQAFRNGYKKREIIKYFAV